MEKDLIQLEVTADITEAQEKISYLVELLKEANSLTKELASETKKLHIKCQID